MVQFFASTPCFLFLTTWRRSSSEICSFPAETDSPSARPADRRGGEPGAEEEKLDDEYDEDAAHVETPHTDEEIVLPSADSTICSPSSA